MNRGIEAEGAWTSGRITVRPTLASFSMIAASSDIKSPYLISAYPAYQPLYQNTLAW
uniref:Uncharacterized protein n=1 Tax=mine drainage metagenome TaxID=410659 RepID=E6QAB5_9ZZZZ